MTFRDAIVRLHRWVGLTMAGFLLIAALTGTLIAFEYEIDRALNPDLLLSDSVGKRLPLQELIARVEAYDSRLSVATVELDVPLGTSVEFFVRGKEDPETGKPAPLGFAQVYADPVTGEILGSRARGGCCSRQTIVRFVHELHYTLQGGRFWRDIMGYIAIAWMFDCFVGFYLTLPRGRPFWRKWQPAWQIKRRANTHRFNLDLHRASGLWLWGIMFLMAFSAIELNLSQQVFRPVVGLISPVTPTVFDTRKPAKRAIPPAFDFAAAVKMATDEARRLGWEKPAYRAIVVERYGVYRVLFGERLPTGLGNNSIDIDLTTGAILDRRVPGEGSLGDILVDAQYPLHSGQIAGLPGRIFISAMGAVLTTLCVTGIVIWWKKRATRRLAKHRRKESISGPRALRHPFKAAE